jgi:DUF4097 and DUF4098 domain-containing protein YvlB
MTARRQRGAALLAGGVLGLIFTTIAAFQIAGWTIGAVEITSRKVVTGPVTSLRVDAGPGEILLLPSQDGRLHVNSTAKGALHTPQLRATRNGTEVELKGECPAITFGPCHAEIRLAVPLGATVHVDASSGDITADGLSGRVWLKTGSGDVTANGLTGGAELRTSSGDVSLRGGRGDITLHSASGDVSAGDVASDRVDATTSSGDVDLDFRQAPRLVEASTASGDVQVALPDGLAYDVETDTGSGDSEIGVRTDPGSPHIVRARTNSGDAIVDYGT